MKINYIRLQRISSNSWITFRLAESMAWKDEKSYEALMMHLAFVMPGWELIGAHYNNPDNKELQANDPWP